MPELMFMDEVSALTRLPESTLRYFRRVGEGPPSYRLGRRVVYLADEVNAWLQQHLTPAADLGGQAEDAEPDEDPHEGVELERLDGPAVTPRRYRGPGGTSLVERARGEVDAP